MSHKINNHEFLRDYSCEFLSSFPIQKGSSVELNLFIRSRETGKIVEWLYFEAELLEKVFPALGITNSQIKHRVSPTERTTDVKCHYESYTKRFTVSYKRLNGECISVDLKIEYEELQVILKLFQIPMEITIS